MHKYVLHMRHHPAEILDINRKPLSVSNSATPGGWARRCLRPLAHPWPRSALSCYGWRTVQLLPRQWTVDDRSASLSLSSALSDRVNVGLITTSAKNRKGLCTWGVYQFTVYSVCHAMTHVLVGKGYFVVLIYFLLSLQQQALKSLTLGHSCRFRKLS